ncbi:MAG TPA: 2-oxo-4-hydroxy-4-carboxy-5-ureidoimidazoline decarboxylase [Vicinamibacterales bacterium]|nr:2-oxo-4-hydroxy-4-carboxy-5-ureidoimidazoline decarboxylase [Vicinamibacterales bacterium]
MDAWQRLDAASEDDAREFFLSCCGSGAWVARMLAHRPFGSDEQLHAMARQEWFALTPDDWREAFAQHPKIGDRDALRARFPATADLSAEEQRGVSDASGDTLDALADANRAYEETFGYIFIVCATGKNAEEMLALLHERLHNDPQTELLIAAGEQAKITELRLRRL